MVLFGAVFGWGLLSGGGQKTKTGEIPEEG
jgi:hypothetical protein